jgi:hypothetical protein
MSENPYQLLWREGTEYVKAAGDEASLDGFRTRMHKIIQADGEVADLLIDSAIQSGWRMAEGRRRVWRGSRMDRFDADWITWTPTSRPPSVVCAYCEGSLPQGDDASASLMLWRKDGHVARLCPRCSVLARKEHLDTLYPQPTTQRNKSA